MKLSVIAAVLTAIAASAVATPVDRPSNHNIVQQPPPGPTQVHPPRPQQAPLAHPPNPPQQYRPPEHQRPYFAAARDYTYAGLARDKASNYALAVSKHLADGEEKERWMELARQHDKESDIAFDYHCKYTQDAKSNPFVPMPDTERQRAIDDTENSRLDAQETIHRVEQEYPDQAHQAEQDHRKLRARVAVQHRRAARKRQEKQDRPGVKARLVAHQAARRAAQARLGGGA